MKWFRFYAEVLHDPKVQGLRPELFKFWVNMLCLASQQTIRGTIPDPEAVALATGVRRDVIIRFLGELETRGLVEWRDFGKKSEVLPKHPKPHESDVYTRARYVHQWDFRQPSRDFSKERTSAYRERTSKHKNSLDSASQSRHRDAEPFEGLETSLTAQRSVFEASLKRQRTVKEPSSKPRENDATNGDETSCTHKSSLDSASLRRAVDTDTDSEKENTLSPSNNIPTRETARAREAPCVLEQEEISLEQERPVLRHPAADEPIDLPSTPIMRPDDAEDFEAARLQLAGDPRTEHVAMEMGRQAICREVVAQEGWRWLYAAEVLLSPTTPDPNRNWRYFWAIVRKADPRHRHRRQHQHPVVSTGTDGKIPFAYLTPTQKRMRLQSEALRKIDISKLPEI